MRDPLEVARAAASSWHGPDYEDIIKGAGGLQADGLWGCTGAVGVTENEDVM